MTAPSSEAEALGDRVWFNDNPQRRYRLRRGGGSTCIIRKRGASVLLRTVADGLPRGCPDTDITLREAWIAAAWIDLNPRERAELARQIKRGEK